MSKGYSSLDGVRAIGAIMIILFHFAGFVDWYYSAVPELFTITKIAFGLGVQIFFILSGIALCFGYFDRLNSRSDVKRYYFRRFFRIVPIYLVLVFLWGLVYYMQGVTFSVQYYLSNITFMFQFVPGQSLGIVGGFGWTLGVIFVLYLLFPILVLFIRKIKIALILLVGSLIFSSYSYDYMLATPGISAEFSNTFFILHFPYFILGIVLFMVLRNKISNEEFLKKTRTKIIGLVLIISSIIAFYIFATSNTLAALLRRIPLINVNFYIWGLILTAFITGLVFFPWKGIVNRVTKFIADRSYSIYLFHPNVMFFTKPVPDAIFGIIENDYLAFLTAFAFFFAVTLGVSILTYRYIEQPALKYGPDFFLKRTKYSKMTNEIY